VSFFAEKIVAGGWAIGSISAPVLAQATAPAMEFPKWLDTLGVVVLGVMIIKWLLNRLSYYEAEMKHREEVASRRIEEKDKRIADLESQIWKLQAEISTIISNHRRDL
jgi:hypothetical protein